MDYVIKNNKNIYIKLSINGRPETCGEMDKGLFDKVKAENILNSLPKTLKKMKFRVECIPDIKIKSPVDQIIQEETQKKKISNCNYKPSENITRWVEKFGTCSDIFKEAKERYLELEKELHISDAALMDILHSIELEPPKDLYSAYLLYKKIRENRRNRRQLKDEMLIIHNILVDIDENKINRERTKRAIEGLFDRKYSYRIVEVDEDAM